jgi:hypothetical protein
MLARLLAALLALLLVVPTGARAAVHRCGEMVVTHCACEEAARPSGERLQADGADACCRVTAARLGGSAPTVLPGGPALPAMDVAPAPPAPAPPAAREVVEAAPHAPLPARGPPAVPLFLRNRALLN